jgi:predicted DNA-binding protein
MKKPNEMKTNDDDTKMVSFRAPVDLVEKLDALFKEKGTDRTEVILEALKADLTAVADSVLRKKMADIQSKLGTSAKEAPKPPLAKGR